jgi:hypothetical protein
VTTRLLARRTPFGRPSRRTTFSPRRSRRPASKDEEQQRRFRAQNKKPIGGREAQVALNLAEALDDHDDVQNVYSDFDISDEELAQLGAG